MASALAKPSSIHQAEELPRPGSLVRLNRRKPRVIVRSPEASPESLPSLGFERRGHVPTLTGIGTRELQPTLFDSDEAQAYFENDDTQLPPSTRPRVHAICEMDEATTAELLLEAERLSLCFEWEKD